MANYRVKPDKGSFRILETKTGYLLHTFKTHAEAKVLSKKLNGGAGFDGDTPSFIADMFKDKKKQR